MKFECVFSFVKQDQAKRLSYKGFQTIALHEGFFLLMLTFLREYLYKVLILNGLLALKLIKNFFSNVLTFELHDSLPLGSGHTKVT